MWGEFLREGFKKIAPYNFGPPHMIELIIGPINFHPPRTKIKGGPKGSKVKAPCVITLETHVTQNKQQQNTTKKNKKNKNIRRGSLCWKPTEMLSKEMDTPTHNTNNADMCNSLERDKRNSVFSSRQRPEIQRLQHTGMLVFQSSLFGSQAISVTGFSRYFLLHPPTPGLIEPVPNLN